MWGRLGTFDITFVPEIGWRWAIAQSTRNDLTLQNLLDLKRFSKFEGLSEILKTKALLQKMQSGSQKWSYSLVNECGLLTWVGFWSWFRNTGPPRRFLSAKWGFANKSGLSSSRCIFSTFSINKSTPWANFTSIYKIKKNFLLKTKKVRATWNRHSKIFEIEKIHFFRSQFFHFHTIFNENFRKFSKFFDLKKFRMPISTCSNFFRFQ